MRDIPTPIAVIVIIVVLALALGIGWWFTMGTGATGGKQIGGPRAGQMKGVPR